jgi:hypothetical protein
MRGVAPQMRRSGSPSIVRRRSRGSLPRLHLKLNDFWQFTRLRCGSLRASRISGGSDAGARGADDAGSPTWPSSSVTAVNYSAAGEEAEIGFKVHPRVRFRHGERRPRYAGPPSMAWPPQHPAYGALYGSSRPIGSRVLAGLLAGGDIVASDVTR